MRRLPWRALLLPGAGLLVVAAFVAAVIVFNTPVQERGVRRGSPGELVVTAQPTTPAGHTSGTTSTAPQTVTVSGGRVADPSAPLPGQPLTLSVPAVGVSAQVGAMARPDSGAIDPPTSWKAYWISAYGQVGPTSDNTAYIAGHTCRGAGCQAVFQPFLDVPHSATTVHTGDQVIVTSPSGRWVYTVTGTEKYSKASIASDAKLWQKVAGRLVLICCFQYQGGTSSQQNYIVYAQLNPGQK